MARIEAERRASIAPAELEEIQGEHDPDENKNRKDGGHRRTPIRLSGVASPQGNDKADVNCLEPPLVIVKHMLNQLPDLDSLFHALADPARRAMVERLSRGPAPVSELARPLPMSLPAAMQHLSVLEAAGLVRSEKVGRVRTCSIQSATLSQAEQWINARRQAWDRRLDRLGDYLQSHENEGKPE
jgi:DNA-binding transcriptional ArsR family regulator